MITSQDSTAGDTVGGNHVTDMVRTSPARKQRMNAYEEVDEFHTFRHWCLKQSFVPTIRYGLEVSGEQCLRPSIHGDLHFFLDEMSGYVSSRNLEVQIPEDPSTTQRNSCKI
jgi:hypothetical protein